MSALINENEAIVFEIIQDYLKSNKPVDVDKLVPYISSVASKKSINVNAQGIKKIIQKLLKKNLIVEGSRLVRRELMENEKRKTIYEYVRENPAVYHHQIITELDIPNHIAVWHLNVLLDFDLIRKFELDNHDLFHDTKITPHQARLLYYLRNEKSRDIIKHLKKHAEGRSKTQLSKELSMHPNTVRKYVNKLENIQILVKKRQSAKTIYQLSRNLAIDL